MTANASAATRLPFFPVARCISSRGQSRFFFLSLDIHEARSGRAIFRYPGRRRPATRSRLGDGSALRRVDSTVVVSNFLFLSFSLSLVCAGDQQLPSDHAAGKSRPTGVRQLLRTTSAPPPTPGTMIRDPLLLTTSFLRAIDPGSDDHGATTRPLTGDADVQRAFRLINEHSREQRLARAPNRSSMYRVIDSAVPRRTDLRLTD